MKQILAFGDSNTWGLVPGTPERYPEHIRWTGILRKAVAKPGFRILEDGLCGRTDEDNLGFTYAVLDRYIREGVIDDDKTKALIDRKHELNLFKLQLMPSFEFDPNTAD